MLMIFFTAKLTQKFNNGNKLIDVVQYQERLFGLKQSV